MKIQNYYEKTSKKFRSRRQIELLNGVIGVISGLAINEYKNEAVILYENGMKTYALPDEDVEILSELL